MENSWSEKRGHKGYCLMTDAWFDEYNYQLVVAKDKLTKDVLDVLQQKPIVLPPWDPMVMYILYLYIILCNKCLVRIFRDRSRIYLTCLNYKYY